MGFCTTRSLAGRFFGALMACCGIAGSRSLVAQTLTAGNLVQIGSETEQRLRLSQIVDSASSANFLMRSASTLNSDWLRSRDSSARNRNAVAFTLLSPEVAFTYNASLPYSMNDGPMWAGRGGNALYTAGVGVSYGWLQLIAAPQFTTSQNLEFQVIPYNGAELRSLWANPFHPSPSSIDLPLRFGDRKLHHVSLGQSSLTARLPYVAIGVGTENMWWGPGADNAIIMSNNAAGFPHAFVRTSDEGLKTRVGRFDAQWMIGRLNESDFFNTVPYDNVRSLSGFVMEYTPKPNGGLHLGVARTVFEPTNAGNIPFKRIFSVFRSAGNYNTSATDIAKGAGPDQITSLFARWIVPEAHLESYVEWARFEQPKSLRDFLEYPEHSQGYTLGIQWAHPLAVGRTFRLATEVTYLEPDPSIRLRPVATTYASQSVPQGYTNEGQALGAAIGPGSSSQTISADVFGAAWRLGTFASRIRWDNAVLWTSVVPEVKNEDVSLLAGLRGSATWKRNRITLEYTDAVRLDYLFQDHISDPAKGLHSGVDIRNRTLSITLSTLVGR
jgi:hypothetical protein